LIEVYQGNCGEQAGALVQRGYSLFWTRCEGLKGPPPCLVHLVDENGQFCGAISFASLGSADSEGARQTVCRRSRRGALATCCAVRLAARAKVMTRELAPGDVPLIVEREPRSSAVSSRHPRKLYFVFPLSEVQRACQAGLPDLQSFARCSSAGRPAARSYRPVVQVIYTDLHIAGIVRRLA
jgi:hypothetical protein